MAKRGRPARFDEATKERARDMYKNKIPMSQIARELGTTNQSVRAWVVGQGSAPAPSKRQQPLPLNLATSSPGVDFERLFGLLVDRLATLETDATKRAVLALLKRRPEHLQLLEDLYAEPEPFREEQAPAVARESEPPEPETEEAQPEVVNQPAWNPGEARTRKRRAA